MGGGATSGGGRLTGATSATGAGTTGGPSAAGGAGGGGKDWAAETTDRIEQLVTTIRTQTTDRLLSIARLLVYGLLAAIMGLMALVLVVVALVRALDELIPQEVWLTYLLLGAIFVVAGLFLWSKRAPRPSKA